MAQLTAPARSLTHATTVPKSTPPSLRRTSSLHATSTATTPLLPLLLLAPLCMVPNSTAWLHGLPLAVRPASALQCTRPCGASTVGLVLATVSLMGGRLISVADCAARGLIWCDAHGGEGGDGGVCDRELWLMPQTMGNTMPRVITVAASMIDRAFPTSIRQGNNRAYVASTRSRLFPCIFARVSRSSTTRLTDSQKILASSLRSPEVAVDLTHTVVGQEVSSLKVAWFSSRGPALPFPGVLKSDIAAPGVSILGAYRDSYNVSGVVALLKAPFPVDVRC
ncbi:hypothetical protein ZIOFF_020459 [Zingiber officinale]|uniref:Uncharacterized protein n=1 Tax=Zingiber officinale TaxID=94328 RepID=A0A8J5H6G3_ZINOF|nr:hypothetical protein ZIOFF_020459 [Zingiber officinale]